ncbi:MAG: hypothetical protein H6578_02270 [Chitinophagales bacterium]|nr:hypothetical protein [Chitinophagales bacterium]
MKKGIYLLAILFFCYNNSYSQIKENIDFQDFMKEIQIWQKNENKMNLIWWLPSNYWEITKQMNPGVSEEGFKIFEDAFQDYYLVFTLSAEIVGADFSYRSYSAIFDNLKLIDSKGRTYLPINEINLPTKTVNIMAVFKPIIEKMIGGGLGKGIQFYLFPKKDNKGSFIIDEDSQTEFAFTLFQNKFTYNLPLVSLMEDKYCPVDNKIMKGNWEYCPFHGVKLD